MGAKVIPSASQAQLSAPLPTQPAAQISDAAQRPQPTGKQLAGETPAKFAPNACLR